MRGGVQSFIIIPYICITGNSMDTKKKDTEDTESSPIQDTESSPIQDTAGSSKEDTGDTVLPSVQDTEGSSKEDTVDTVIPSVHDTATKQDTVLVHDEEHHSFEVPLDTPVDVQDTPPATVRVHDAVHQFVVQLNEDDTGDTAATSVQDTEPIPWTSDLDTASMHAKALGDTAPSVPVVQSCTVPVCDTDDTGETGDTGLEDTSNEKDELDTSFSNDIGAIDRDAALRISKRSYAKITRY